MIVVIIAGGSGTRLWPLSTPEYPKHLLTVNNDERSLLQNTYRRAKELADSVYVISEVGHVHHVKEQLPELPESAFIAEPARRGTASCIVAGLAEVAKHHPRDEPIAILSADHFIRDVQGFVHSFSLAGEVSQQTGRVVLVGIEPDYPATGFGYIQKGEVFNEDSFVFNVHSFKEKPALDVAQEYLKSGNYLWNSGCFVGSIDTFARAMEQHAPALLHNMQALQAATPDTYADTYLGFQSDSIDYALIEKLDDLLVVPAAFDWMDLGSFGDLYKAADHDAEGNHVSGQAVALDDVTNAFVQNTEDKPLAVIGLDNVVVVNTPHGIVVARKDLSQRVKEAVAQLQAK